MAKDLAPIELPEKKEVTIAVCFPVEYTIPRSMRQEFYSEREEANTDAKINLFKLKYSTYRTA